MFSNDYYCCKNIKIKFCTKIISIVTYNVILPLSNLNNPAAVHLALRPVALIPECQD